MFVHSLLLIFFVYVCLATDIVKTSVGDELISSLVKRVCDYPEIPENNDFTEVIKGLIDSPLITDKSSHSKMKTAYILSAHLLFEHYSKFVSYLPLLLHCSAVMYSAGHTQETPESDTVFLNAIHCVLMLTEETNTDVRGQALELFSKARHNTVWSSDEINTLSMLLVSVNPSIRHEWARIALNWALFSDDSKAVIDSLYLLYLFTPQDESGYTESLVEKFLLCFMKYVLYSQQPCLLVLTDVFISMPSDLLHAKPGLLSPIIEACGIALSTALPSQYIVAVDVIQYMYNSLDELSPQMLYDALSRAWSDPIKANKAIMRGFFSQSTVPAALWLCEVISSIAPSGSPLFRKEALLIFLSIIYCLLICSKDSDAITGALRFSKSGPAFMEPIFFAFSDMDMRNIPVAKHKDWKEMLRNFMSAFYKAFPLRDDFLMGVDFVTVLLRRGPEKLIPPLLEMAGYFIRPYENSSSGPLQPITSSQLLQLAELIVFYTNSESPSIARSAVSVLPTIIFNIPQEVNMRFYDCLREPTKQSVYAQTGSTSSPIYFTGYTSHASSLVVSFTNKFCSSLFSYDCSKKSPISAELVDELWYKSKGDKENSSDFAARKYRVPMPNTRKPYDALPFHVVVTPTFFPISK